LAIQCQKPQQGIYYLTISKRSYQSKSNLSDKNPAAISFSMPFHCFKRWKLAFKVFKIKINSKTKIHK
jgi:hypothetical protein